MSPTCTGKQVYINTFVYTSNIYLYTGCQRGRARWETKTKRDTDEEVSRIPTCWDSDVVRLLGSASVGDVGTLPLESVISRVRLSLVGFSHLVTRNLRQHKGVFECFCSLGFKWGTRSRTLQSRLIKTNSCSYERTAGRYEKYTQYREYC